MMNKRILALFLALAMVMSIAPDLCLSASAAETSDTYTYDTYETETPANWSPMAWSNSGDSFVRTYTQTPLVDISVKNAAKAEFQWVFLGATSITDVSSQFRGDEVPGYVYEIALNPDLCWEDGTPINADTYIYSMQQLLDPDMQYPQAKQFYNGILAISGAEAYVLAGRTVMRDNGVTGVVASEEDMILGEDGNYYDPDGYPLYIPLTTQMQWLHASLKEYVEAYGEAYFDVASYAKLEEMADSNGNVVLNAQTLALLKSVITLNGWEPSADCFTYYIASSVTYSDTDWSTVGLTKVDEYTIRYSCVNQCLYFNFLSAMRDNNWLIHKELYESCKAAGTYGTSVDTTMSYGPYRLERVDDNQIVLVRNENHFEYTADSNGRLSSTTSFQVDGKTVPQWNMDSIVLNLNLGDDGRRNSFLAGDLDYWAPHYSEATEYAASPAFRKKIGETTFSLFLNADLATLQNMDANYGTTNAVVLSNYSFRKAFSLAMDRSELAMIDSVRIPATTLFGDTFYYDIEQDPASNFRKSEMAMQAICDLYGVEYGAGAAYATLEEAYESITGYDLNTAKSLMAQACEELVAAGLYTKGEPIVFLYAGSSAEPGAFYTAILNEIAGSLNEAAEGSGFGDISIEYVNTGWGFSNAVRSGEVTMLLGGWSGSAYNPYMLMELYLEPGYSYVPNNLDVNNENLTLDIAGKEYTMTWTQWYEMLAAGSGDFADAQRRAEALAELEAAYIGQYFAIPIFADATGHMLGYQVDYYTDAYNLMYGFGGLRLMRFNYTDAQWDAYVASGKLDYMAPAVEPPVTESKCGENLTWELNDSGTLTISGTGAMYDYAAGAAPWYDRRDQIINVVVSEGVTTIGEYAFYDLSNVGKTAVAPASVSANAISGNGFHLPATLQTIGEGAFSGCSGVTVVEFPAAVESIGDDAFSGCTALKEIVFQGDAPEIGETAFEDVQAKVTYPEDNETWTEEVKENYGGNITWGEEKVYSITWVEAYASLGGNIAVVFKADLSEDLVEDPNAFMRFTYAGKTVDVPVSEASRAGNYYNFFCRITSVNMTDDITAQMMVGEEAIGRSVTTSLEKYCSYIISNSTDTKTVNLMKAMLNYGAAAQKMMNYKPDNLANKSLSDADKVLTAVDATQYKHSITGTEDGIKPVEALLVLGSETTIRVGFQLTGNKTIEEYTFTVDGVEVEPVLKGGKYVLEVPNIAAHRLDEYHTFTCGVITVTYCGLSYVNQVMGYYTEGTTFDMAAALYNYSQATEAYTEANIF